MKYLNSLQRITSSTKFIPEIDGLRFIAIISVVLYHLNGFVSEKSPHVYIDNTKTMLWNIFSRGHLGVELFFTISGFILAYPFALHFLKGTDKPLLKQYFLRRLTRLEPPYIISMIVLFIASIVMGKYTFNELLPSLLASLTYTHNIVYNGQMPFINAVAWSLEIEIQFYIIAPYLAEIFRINTLNRRILIVLLIFIFVFLNSIFKTQIPNIFNYIQYFAIGFLLADLKISETKFKIGNKLAILLGVFSFISIWLFDTKNLDVGNFTKVFYNFIIILGIFSFYSLVLFCDLWRKIFSIQILTVLGGMCYSIYLIHYPIISMFGNLILSRLHVSKYYFIDFVFYSLLLIIPILIISTLYFKFIEQPCMRKDWYKKYFLTLKKTF
jgi:peptidoglycan/LPS O-acetylase OafA/YrhL